MKIHYSPTAANQAGAMRNPYWEDAEVYTIDSLIAGCGTKVRTNSGVNVSSDTAVVTCAKCKAVMSA